MMSNFIKSGITTTEFWLTFILFLISLCGLAFSHNDNIILHITFKCIFAVMIIFPVCSYSISRGMSKSVDFMSATQVIKTLWDMVDRENASYDVNSLMQDIHDKLLDIESDMDSDIDEE